jgi:hypothetical protein
MEGMTMVNEFNSRTGTIALHVVVNPVVVFFVACGKESENTKPQRCCDDHQQTQSPCLRNGNYELAKDENGKAKSNTPGNYFPDDLKHFAHDVLPSVFPLVVSSITRLSSLRLTTSPLPSLRGAM